MRGSIRRVAFVGDVEVAVSEELRGLGFRVEQIESDSIVRAARELVRMRPTLVHARKNHLKVGLVAHLLNIPFVVQAGTRDVNGLTARAARMAERTLCGGASIREGLLVLGAPASSTVVVRGLLETKDLAGHAVFEPMADSKTRWVVSASPCDGADRGHSDLLLAFASIARTRPELRLLLAGAGIDSRSLMEQIEHSGLHGRAFVHHTTIDHLPGLFTRAAAVVAPSRTPNQPDAVPEALALGAPVVATAVGMHSTWVREGRTGFLVPPRSPGSLAARLVQVLDDAQLAHRVGQAAMRDAHEHQRPSNVALSLTRCWSGTARPPPSPFAGMYLPPSRHRAVNA
ncbi:MAG: glycosyltransferase [Deltaproteobacteria bacterium]|nr:MAG: glycosyltransferase [Deltaproteobacteria bacterium]